jgi:predicted GTPase
VSKLKPAGYSRLLVLAVALLLPAASLIPIGSLWLFEHGYLLAWAIGTLIVVVGAFHLQTRLMLPPASAALPAETASPGDPSWTPAQAEAWEDVLKLASAVSPERMSSRDGIVALGLETIELVSRRLHPRRRDPLLQFTVPEALAVIERTSRNLRGFLISSFPLGDRITVAQLMWLYRWRGALQLVEKGYDLWRIVRVLNPVTAATHELRERFTRQIYEAGREQIARRLARAFVKEVGRAAIDLYSGNLQVSLEQVQAHVTLPSRNDLAASRAREAEPVRILVAGETGAGKSSVINALANVVEAVVDALPSTTRFTAYRLEHEGLPAGLIIDSPGLTGPGMPDALIEAAHDCDMLLWVASATRAAREGDARALGAIRAHFTAEPNRRRPPMLLVLTHIDALRPFNEWDPPYNLTASADRKSQSIRDAMQGAGSELGFASDEIVPVRVDIAVAPYNIDAVWAKIIELMPDAKRTRLLRILEDIKSASAWGALWSQAANAGRVIKKTFFGKDPLP